MSLKIAHITPYYFPSIGGVAGVSQYLSEELVKSGHSVDVITARRDHKGRQKLSSPLFEIINGVNVYRYRSLLNIGHMSLFPSLFSHLMRNKYDVLHYHSYRHPLCDISAFIGKLKNSVNILHGHGPFFEEGEISKFKHYIYGLYDKVALRTVLKCSDKIIALNSYEEGRYIQLGIKPSKIIVIPNAAENICFNEFNTEPFLLKYGLLGKKILLFVGILNLAKRPDLLVKALPKIIKEVPSAHLVLVGPDGGFLNKVKVIVKQFTLEKNITITGPLYGTEKQMAFSSASLFLLPSDLDAYPLVLSEALAHGLPVVTTNARGPADIISDGINGYIVQKGDLNKISEKSILLLNDSQLHKQFSDNAKRIAINKFSAPAVTKKIELLYLDILEQKFIK